MFNNLFDIRDKVALVTGGSRGIGEMVAAGFLANGAKVYISSRKADACAATAERLQAAYGGECIAIPANLADVEGCQQLADTLSAREARLDILINNAGITKDNLLMRMAEEDFDQVIEVNLKSVFNMTKAVQRTFLKQRKGSLIHMSSVVGVKGNAGQANYAASKAGIIGFSKSIALELGSRNIRSNVIAPGFIETEMTAKLPEDVVQGWRSGIPLKRGGSPEDIANACVFLGSDLSNYITGQVLNVDGGMLT